jgi:hypothetical protein
MEARTKFHVGLERPQGQHQRGSGWAGQSTGGLIGKVTHDVNKLFKVPANGHQADGDRRQRGDHRPAQRLTIEPGQHVMAQGGPGRFGLDQEPDRPILNGGQRCFPEQRREHNDLVVAGNDKHSNGKHREADDEDGQNLPELRRRDAPSNSGSGMRMRHAADHIDHGLAP